MRNPRTTSYSATGVPETARQFSILRETTSGLLLRLDAGLFHDISISVDLGAHEFGGLLGRRIDRTDFAGGETLLDCFRIENFGKGLAQASDDVLGCPGRRNKPVGNNGPQR